MRSFGFHRFLVAAATASSLLVGASSAALADVWPSRSIKLIVPFPAGGAADTIARIYSDKLSEALGQSIVVENKAEPARDRVICSADPDAPSLAPQDSSPFCPM